MARPDRFTKQLELQARYVLATPYAENVRVLDLGGACAPGLVALAEAGARELAVAAADTAAAEEAISEAGVEGVELLQEADGSLPCDDGAYDLIVCHDLPERISQNPAWADELRRVLAADGFLVAAVANPNGQFLSEVGGERYDSAIPYAELSEMLAPLFGGLTVFGQSPLVASLFFDFADTSEETGLTLDRSLLPDADEEPGWYVMVFGPEERHRDDLNIVQLPFPTLLAAAGASGEAPQEEYEEEEYEEEVAEEEPASDALSSHAQQVIESLESDRQAAVAQAQAADAALAALRLTVNQLQSHGAGGELAHALGAANDRVAQMESELLSSNAQSRDHEARQAKLETELERSRHDKASYETQIKDLLEEVNTLRRQELAQDSDATQLDEARGELERTRAQAGEEIKTLRLELDSLKQQLGAARESNGTLQAELMGLRNGMTAAGGTNAVAPRARDAVGRELDSAVEELEDLLKDVAPAGR